MVVRTLTVFQMGLRRRYLPDTDTALRSGDGKRVTVALQCVFSFRPTCRALTFCADFVLSKVTPTMVTDLGYKLFLMFATINIGGMAVFTL